MNGEAMNKIVIAKLEINQTALVKTIFEIILIIKNRIFIFVSLSLNFVPI